MRSRAGLGLLLMVGSGLVSAAGHDTENNDKLRWSIIPYIWGSTTKVDLKFGGSGVGSGETTFSDLLDVLDAAVMLHVEAGKGRWSVFGDLTYIETSDTTQRPVITVDADSQATVFDAALVFWPQGVASPLSLFGGLRYTDFDDRYVFSAGGTEIDRRRSDADYYDALFGVRYRFDLADRWQLLTHGDVSFGDSEGTFLVRADIAYVVGQRRQNRILAGYQYKQADFKDKGLEKDFTYYGPLVGFDFRF